LVADLVVVDVGPLLLSHREHVFRVEPPAAEVKESDEVFALKVF
jgi:hypothetical protein